MIPVTLKVSNFLCYGEDVPEIDFEGLHLICLSGQNGNGKSSLLDALTWSIWGQARKAGRKATPGTGVIRHGARSCSVEFTFRLLDKDNSTFTVYRELYLSSSHDPDKSTMKITFEQISPKFRSLTGKTNTGTQEEISRIIGMGFETFVSSVFLKQNDAGRFTEARPAQRKEVFHEVIGLERFKALNRKAKQEHDQFAGKLKGLQYHFSQNTGALEQVTEDLKELKDVEKDLEIAKARLEHEKEVLQKLKAQEMELNKAKERLTTISQEVTGLEETKISLDRSLNAHKETIRQYYEILEKEEDVVRAHTVYEETRIKASSIDQVYQEFLRISSEQKVILTRIEELKRNLEKDLKTTQEALEAETAQLKEKQKERTEYEERLTARIKVEQKITELEGQRIICEKDLREAFSEDNARSEETKRLLTQEQELIKKIKFLEDAPEGTAECPLCSQPLSEEAFKRLLIELIQEKETKRKFAEANMAVESKQPKLNTRHSEIEQTLDVVRDTQAELTRIAERLTSVTEDITFLQASISVKRQRYEKLQTLLKTGEYKESLEEKLSELVLPEYDAEEHERIRALFGDEELQSKNALYEQLTVAKSGVETLTPICEQEEQRIGDLLSKIKKLTKERENLGKTIETLQQDTFHLDEITQAVQHWQQSCDLLLRRVGQKEALTTRQEELMKTLAELSVEIARLEKSVQVYAYLQEIFGRDGIPAWLTSTALPELEKEVNDILQRLLRGAVVYFKTEYETGSGSTVETLEIMCQYRGFEQPYELFSGGEQFRINFAIRVGLAQLLCKRHTGFPLKVLVIDEGFGSQDAEGRETFLKAIYDLAEDFLKIIVITHIEELKEQFPARIEVSKIPGEGSTLAVIT